MGNTKEDEMPHYPIHDLDKRYRKIIPVKSRFRQWYERFTVADVLMFLALSILFFVTCKMVMREIVKRQDPVQATIIELNKDRTKWPEVQGR